MPGSCNSEGWFYWPCKSSSARSLLHRCIDVDSRAWLLLLALSILTPENCFGLTLPPWWSFLECCLFIVSLELEAPVSVTHTVPCSPIYRLHNQVTERLDSDTEQVSNTAKSLDTVCILCLSCQQERGGSDTQSFSGGKNRNLEGLKEWFTIRLHWITLCLKSPALGSHFNYRLHPSAIPVGNNWVGGPAWKHNPIGLQEEDESIGRTVWHAPFMSLHMRTTDLLFLWKQNT